ncbi:acid stress response protein YqgB [Yokenella regensburgei]|nr:acid stress response protein YqgB [Yokenella regensburgei]
MLGSRTVYGLLSQLYAAIVVNSLGYTLSKTI